VVCEELVMLSNIYPSEKIEEDQHSWLTFIRENEWEREVSSMENLFNHLFPYFATSIIQDKLKQFKESNWYRQNRLKKHCFLVSKRADFKKQLDYIS
jgi:hypothetical protein